MVCCVLVWVSGACLSPLVLLFAKKCWRGRKVLLIQRAKWGMVQLTDSPSVIPPACGGPEGKIWKCFTNTSPRGHVAPSCSVKCPVWCREGQQTNRQGGWYLAKSVLHYKNENKASFLSNRRGPCCLQFHNLWVFYSLLDSLSFVILTAQCVNTVP